jgi:hypothetical protein
MKPYRFSIFLLLAFAVTFFSCRKRDVELEQQVEHARDAADFDAEAAEILQNIDLTASSSGMKGGRTEAINICGASADSTTVPGTIILTFDGTTPCVNGTRKRSGQIKLTLTNGRLWVNSGAELKAEFVNYRIEWLATGRKQTFNGIKTVKNVSGGSITLSAQAAVNATIIHEIRGNFNVLFESGASAVWNFARKRETVVAGANNISVTITGIGSYSGMNNLAAWGKNRFGGDFYTVISTPIQANKSCGFHKPTAGVVIHDGQYRDISVTFGTDASGNPMTSCPTHFKVLFEKNGNTHTRIVAYPN